MARQEFYFYEAVGRMSPGDVFSPHRSEYGEFYMTEDRELKFEDGENITLHSDHFNLLGFIIPAKKEPVSFRNWHLHNGRILTDKDSPYSYAEESWKASAENRDLLYADLMEAIRRGISAKDESEYESISDDIRAAYNNIIDVLSTTDHRKAGEGQRHP